MTCSTKRTASRAEGTGVESAGGAKKPSLQNTRRWSLGHVARQGAGTKGHHKAGPSLELHCRERQVYTMSVAVWCLGGSSHSGDGNGDGNGDKDSGSNSNTRGRMAGAMR